MNAAPPVLLNKVDAAKTIGVSVKTLDRHVAAGEIAAKRLGSRVVFEYAELKRFATDLPSWEPGGAR